MPDHVFRNDGGRFVNVSDQAGVKSADHDGRGLGVLAADLDDDGRVDLYVANDMSANFMFRNQGGFSFNETATESGVAANAGGGYLAGMGIACGDVDGDGRLDLAVTNFYGESTSFYLNLGAGQFMDRTAAIGLAAPSRKLLGFGAAFLDANNDGRLDLATANGHVNDIRPNCPYGMPAQLLLGGASGRLTDVSGRAGAPWQILRRGAAWPSATSTMTAGPTCSSSLKGSLWPFSTTKGRPATLSRSSSKDPHRPQAVIPSALVSPSRQEAADSSPSATAAGASSRRATIGFTSVWASQPASRRSRSAGPQDMSPATLIWRPTPHTSSARPRPRPSRFAVGSGCLLNEDNRCGLILTSMADPRVAGSKRYPSTEPTASPSSCDQVLWGSDRRAKAPAQDSLKMGPVILPLSLRCSALAPAA